MDLKVGSRLGPYEIISAIGKGGMGEVWRARDPRLGRDVAIKVSADQFSDRFEKEARAIAALNHSNICTLFDVGPNYLVMELIEGPTLADRISEGALPLEEALGIARQIGDALEAAHEKGIVHRDLKPGNVKIRPDGSVKVLDFGLAKAVFAESKVTSDSPTLMQLPTQMGVILGTAAYMAPEQARGKEVDKRADIWSFGVVLYEMLTGKRLFQGEDLTETLAAVVKTEPDFSDVPAQVKRLLGKCLQKDPKKRLRDIGDWQALLDTGQPGTTPSRSRFGKSGWIVVGVLAVTVLLLWLRRPEHPANSLVMADIEIGEEVEDPALSRDGTQLTFIARGQLAVRDLRTQEIRYFPGTETARYPFFSPDGKSIGFFPARELRTISLDNGAQTNRCLISAAYSGAWNNDGTIVVSTDFARKLVRVPALGGKCQEDSRFQSGDLSHTQPDGNYLLISNAFTDGVRKRGVYASPLAGGAARLLVPDADSAHYWPGGGKLIYHRRGVLYAVAFDPRGPAVSGPEIALVEGVKPADPQLNGRVSFDIAGPSGTLVYKQGNIADQIVSWLDADGGLRTIIGQPGRYSDLRLSPDGTQLVFLGGSPLHLLRCDVNRCSPARVLKDDGLKDEDFPAWSPDGETLVLRATDNLQKTVSVNLSNRSVVEVTRDMLPWSFSPDGAFLMGFDALGTVLRLHILSVEKTPAGLRYRDQKPLVPLPGRQTMPVVSPDGKWLAFVYASAVSGLREVVVVPFRPDQTAELPRWQVSVDGGNHPRWSTNGEIFFDTPERRIMTATYTVKEGAFHPGKPRVWVEKEIGNTAPKNGFDVTADGKHVVAVLDRDQQKPETRLHLVLNVADELARRAK